MERKLEFLICPTIFSEQRIGQQYIAFLFLYLVSLYLFYHLQNLVVTVGIADRVLYTVNVANWSYRFSVAWLGHQELCLMNSKTEIVTGLWKLMETWFCCGSSRKTLFCCGSSWKPGSVMEAHPHTALLWELRIPSSVVWELMERNPTLLWEQIESGFGVGGSHWNLTLLWDGSSCMERRLWFRSSRKPSLLGAHENPAWCEISNIYNSRNLIFQCYRKLWVL